MSSKNKTVTITHKGIELEVYGRYFPYISGSMEQPPEYEEFEIYGIYYKGNDIYDLCECWGVDFTEIEKECLTNLLY